MPRMAGRLPVSAEERAGVRAARMRRGMFLLPSLFTAGSIGAGYFAITQTIDSVNAVGGGAQHLDLAAIAICLAIPFDALDGRIARMTNTTSEFGKELDSLADAITFGVAPSLLAFVWGFHSLPDSISAQWRQPLLQIGSFVCFLFLLCGVSRLARFNISNNPQPRNPGRLDRKYFVGMPIPAAAGMVAATVHCFYGIPIPNWWLAVLWIGLVGLLERAVPNRLNDRNLVSHLLQLTLGILFIQRSAVFCGAGVYVLWDMGAGGVFVVAAQAAFSQGRYASDICAVVARIRRRVSRTGSRGL